MNDTSETHHYFVIYYMKSMKTIVITILLFMGCSLTGYAQGVQGTKLKKQENNNMKDQKEIYFARRVVCYLERLSFSMGLGTKRHYI